MLEEHIKQMSEKLKVIKARNQSLKDYLERNMLAAEQEIKADDGTLKPHSGKSKAKLTFLDEAQILLNW